MRNLVLRNLTSLQKRRRILSTQEINEQNGVRTHIRRNFIFQIKDSDQNPHTEKSKVYIFKYHNTKDQKDKFLFRLKGSLFAVSNDKIYLVTYVHSFRLELDAV